MTRVVAVAAAAVLLFGCAEAERPVAASRPAAKATSPEAAIREIASPAGAGSMAPFLSTAREGVLLSWIEPVAGTRRHAIRFARLAGEAWTEPRTIAERDDFFVNWADFPSIVQDAKGTLFAHWLQKSSAGTYSYDVQMATSADGGVTWGKPFLLDRDGKEAEHGFVSLAPLPHSGVAAAWLDGRNMTGGDDAHDHGGGDMTVRYAMVSADGTLDGEKELDARVCECCATGMTMTPSGPVIVYRDRSAGEVRDIGRVARTASGWTPPRVVRADGWKINACPVNGPQIDSLDHSVAMAWFTAANNEPRVYAAFSEDDGVTFPSPVRIDGGQPAGRVDIVMLDPETALVTWLEQTGGAAEIRARRISRDGRLDDPITVAKSGTARSTGFTRITRAGRDVYFTWTEGGEGKRVRVAVMKEVRSMK